MTGVAVSREWSNYLKTPRVNSVKSDILEALDDLVVQLSLGHPPLANRRESTLGPNHILCLASLLRRECKRTRIEAERVGHEAFDLSRSG